MLQRLATLFRHVAIYGLGDVAISIVSFLLLPVYVRYLTPEDYGVIGLLVSVEVVAKILSRWGVDASFMRFYFDCEDEAARRRLASTIFWFLLLLDGLLLAAALVAAPALSRHLFGSPRHTVALQLTLANTAVVAFYFLPFHVLRIEGRSAQFIALSFARSAATLVLRLLLVIGAKLGVLGVVLADVIVTVAFTAVLWPGFARLVGRHFSRNVLREVLGFGLPRVPHGVAHQVLAVADRYLLTLFVPLREVGLYAVGATFGLGMKLFLGAFEYAWAPFYFGTVREPDARRTFSLVTTYALAILCLLAAGLAAISTDLVRLMTQPAFYAAAQVVPWIALGVLFQGVYLLTSIGLNITRRTHLYPVATITAATTSIVANLLLIPRRGALGAAQANALSYLVLALTGFLLARRQYPIRYEWDRLASVGVSALAAYVTARVLTPAGWPTLASLLAHGGLVLASYPIYLLAVGFYRPEERGAVMRILGGLRRRTPPAVAEESTEMAGDVVAALPDEAIEELEAGRDHRPGVDRPPFEGRPPTTPRA